MEMLIYGKQKNGKQFLDLKNMLLCIVTLVNEFVTIFFEMNEQKSPYINAIIYFDLKRMRVIQDFKRRQPHGRKNYSALYDSKAVE